MRIKRMYALVEIKGKQYKAEEGAVLKVDHLNREAGTTVEFDRVMMLRGDSEPKIGTPYIEGAKVTATVGESLKAPKVKVLKFKRRKGYHRMHGHRQLYTVIKVDAVSG